MSCTVTCGEVYRHNKCDDIEVVPYLLVELEPGGEAFAVYVLKTKEPHLTQTNGLNHLRGGGVQFKPTADSKRGGSMEFMGVVQKGVVC